MLGAATRPASAGGHDSCPLSLLFLLRTSRGSGSGTFLEVPLPGALKAKGGMSDDFVGNFSTAHVRTRSDESDRGCDPSDR